MAQPAPQLASVPSQREPPSATPPPSRPGQGTLRSPAARRLGPPPAPTPPLGRSRVPIGEPRLSPVETTSPPPDLRSPISPGQPRTSCRALSPSSMQSRAEGGLETLTVRASSHLPRIVPAPVQEPDFSSSSQPAMTGTRPSTWVCSTLSEEGRPRHHSRSCRQRRRRLPYSQQRDPRRPSSGQGSLRERDSPRHHHYLHWRGRRTHCHHRRRSNHHRLQHRLSGQHHRHL